MGLRKLQQTTTILDATIYPVLFRLTNQDDVKKLEELLDINSNITIYDEIKTQIRDLYKIRNPQASLSESILQDAIHQHTKGSSLQEYGVWVYYPWSNKLIHLLDEKEFIEVRTARNLYKITAEERTVLSKKSIGIIGMSVGQSIAITMAMERSFGEIRIADFDHIELSNLNRIRAGIYTLNLPKVIVAAREIAEIDPFLKVVTFPDGINENNIEQFILGNGKLDILIDECDNLGIKVLCREKAKEFKIPVIMETSDRGALDIERFDLEPDLPIFNGRIPGLNYQEIKEISGEELKKYVFPIAGYETFSSRLKSSFKEIGKTITTWPQLASAVALGGGISADICRRICLGQLNVSGRFFIDLEELVCDR